MRKKLGKFLVGAVLLALALTPATAKANESFNTLTELTYYDSGKAYKGYTLFTPMTQGTGGVDHFYSFLIDMQGYLIKKWDIGLWGSSAHNMLLEDGNLLCAVQTKECNDLVSPALNGVAIPGGVINEINWAGKTVFSVKTYQTNPLVKQHHDYRKIWNNQLGQYTYLMLAAQARSATEGYDMGADPSIASAANGWCDDSLVEINRAGKVVWSWSFVDHTVNNLYPGTPNYVTSISDHPEKLNINWAGIKPDWTHANSIDYNRDLDLVVINAKATSEFYVIDHGATFVSTTKFADNINAAKGPAGDFIYRFGCPFRYGQGAPPEPQITGSQQIWGAHNIQWIHPTAYTNGPALPGAGNFLIFDNGWYNTAIMQSAILEINPYRTSATTTANTYVNPPVAGYKAQGTTQFFSNQIAWSFRPKQMNSFASNYISGAQRLPNGNTMIDSGATGHFFEVTSAGEVVWEYTNPVSRGVAYMSQRDIATSNGFACFRAHRYGTDYPAFKGKNLSGKSLLNPKKTITGRTPVNDFYQAMASGKLPGQSSGSGSGDSGGGGGGGGAGGGGGGGSGY